MCDLLFRTQHALFPSLLVCAWPFLGSVALQGLCWQLGGHSPSSLELGGVRGVGRGMRLVAVGADAAACLRVAWIGMRRLSL